MSQLLLFPSDTLAGPPRGKGVSLPLGDFSTLGDLELISAVACKKEAALRAIYDRYGPRMFSGALRALDSAEDAMEVVQDWLVKVWEKAGTYDAALSGVNTWLSMICRGLIANMLRSRHRRLQPLPLLPEAEDRLEGRDLGTPAGWTAELEQIFSQFNVDERRYLDAAIFSPATHEEIAKKFAEPLGTVKTRIRRALDKLKSLIQQELLP